jgi:hypothetical protein
MVNQFAFHRQRQQSHVVIPVVDRALPGVYPCQPCVVNQILRGELMAQGTAAKQAPRDPRQNRINKFEKPCTRSPVSSLTPPNQKGEIGNIHPGKPDSLTARCDVSHDSYSVRIRTQAIKTTC